jgi:hypothetical protein
MFHRKGVGMATKTTGAELKAFYSDTTFWPEGAYHEDDEVIIDGVHRSDDQDIMDIPDESRVVVADGIVLDLPGIDNDKSPSFEGHFKKWRKQQTTVFFTGECPRDILDAVLAAIVAAGGKVIK